MHGQDKPSEAEGKQPLVIEQCLLAEDLFSIQHREPENWRKHAPSAEHSFLRSNPLIPYVIARKHIETVEDQDLMFCLLVFKPLNDEFFGVLFGEMAITPQLFDELVKPLAVEGGIQREATLTADEDEFSKGAQERRWQDFLRDTSSGT